MTHRIHSHCSYCGTTFPIDLAWPRRCARCENTSFRNPIPVAVVLLPYDHGIIAIRRSIPPGQGELALPGGFLEVPDDWCVGGARELEQETGIRMDPHTIDPHPYAVESTPDGTRLLIFGLAEPLVGALPPFTPSEETSERVILRAPTKLAFPIHTRILARYFAERTGG
ncbi:NUDIX domain-containing protein [Candidatus Uhrbacteria bacterium]|nr:NUDIX domain-containing protein [Candidatus Uhrbacteria bacterium]